VQTYYLSDGLGSTSDLRDDDGDAIADYTYDVFGAIRDQSGSSPNEFLFTGEQVDGTGLQYLRARYYDPARLAIEMSLGDLENGLVWA